MWWKLVFSDFWNKVHSPVHFLHLNNRTILLNTKKYPAQKKIQKIESSLSNSKIKCWNTSIEWKTSVILNVLQLAKSLPCMTLALNFIIRQQCVSKTNRQDMNLMYYGMTNRVLYYLPTIIYRKNYKIVVPV